jgi:hypothetical protein
VHLIPKNAGYAQKFIKMQENAEKFRKITNAKIRSESTATPF